MLGGKIKRLARTASLDGRALLARLAAMDRRLLVAIIVGIAALIVAPIALLSGGGDSPPLSDSLAEVLPQIFPTATPTATSTPTTQERIAVLLASADDAWRNAQLDEAIAALEGARSLGPASEEIDHRLFVAYATRGIEEADLGHLEQAVPYLDSALDLKPDHPEIGKLRRMIASYLTGAQHLENGLPGEAANALEPVYALDPGFHGIADMLYQAHYERGLEIQRDGSLWQARAEFIRALEIKPDERMATAQLREIDYLLATPTPTITPTMTPTSTPTPTATPVPDKKILVDISDQHFYAYDGDTLIWDFPCSTGRADSPTRRGTFEVLDKIPNAWGGAWSIWMPYWLGIYWAGASENGIHALPVSLDGSVMWSGYLGWTPISFGCIVLDTYAAKLVYDWADVGTPVIIRD